MEEQDYKAIALSRLTDRHRSDEVFISILDTLVDLKETRQKEILQISESFLDIDKSEGKNLDVIGKLIGEERNLVNFIDKSYFGFLGARLSEAYDIGYWYSLYKNKYGTLRTLTDSEYRRVLKARVIKNSSDSGRNSLLEVLNVLLDNKNTVIIEKENNTAIEVRIRDNDGLASYYLSKYKSDNTLIPIPLGRRLGVVQIKPLYITSKPYPLYFEDGVTTEVLSPDVQQKDILMTTENEESILSSFSLDSAMSRDVYNIYPSEGAEVEQIESSLSIDSANLINADPYRKTEMKKAEVSTNLGVSGAMRKVSLISNVPEAEKITTNLAISEARITN